MAVDNTYDQGALGREAEAHALAVEEAAEESGIDTDSVSEKVRELLREPPIPVPLIALCVERDRSR